MCDILYTSGSEKLKMQFIKVLLFQEKYYLLAYECTMLELFIMIMIGFSVWQKKDSCWVQKKIYEKVDTN